MIRYKGSSRKAQFINLLADQDITKEDYQEAIRINNDELQLLIKKKSELTTQIEKSNYNKDYEFLKKELNKYIEFKTLTPDMLYRLIKRIEISAEGNVKIFYRFSHPFA